MNLVVGVDTHRDTHTMVAIDAVGAVVKQWTVPASPAGYAQAIAEVAGLENVVWGVEGAGSFGRGLVEALLRAGAVVYEVPGILTKRHRKHASRRGKSDAQDARAIAEAVLRDPERLTRCRDTDEQDAVRVLYDRRDRLVRARTEAVNRLRSAALRLEVRDLPKTLTTAAALQKVRSLVEPSRMKSQFAAALVEEIDEALLDIDRLTTLLSAIEVKLAPIVRRLAPSVLELHGVSIIVAAGLVGHAGCLDRRRGAAAFAMRAGVAPVPCSSGRSSAVRVNVGGDRQLNRCLHVMALSQVRSTSHAGRLYYDRKRAEGKTHRQAMRSLKRQLATIVYYRLIASSSTLQQQRAA